VVACAGWGASGRALSGEVVLKLSCARAVEGVKLEKINKVAPANTNGFDHRAI